MLAALKFIFPALLLQGGRKKPSLSEKLGVNDCNHKFPCGVSECVRACVGGASAEGRLGTGATTATSSAKDQEHALAAKGVTFRM